MNRLALIFLAASALVPASAANAQSTVQPPVKWEDTPSARLKVPASQAPARPAPAPGVTWQQRPAGAAPQVRTQVAPASRPMPPVRVQSAPAPRPAPPALPHARVAPAPHAAPLPHHVEVRGHGPAPHGQPQAPVRFEMRRGYEQMPTTHGRHPGVERDVLIHRGGDRMVRRHHGINGYPHYRRIDRGFVMPQYWWGPRFQVMNWGMYGLPQPMHGSRWVRYYDDALLVDGRGRVHDGRWGMRWDEDHWGYDDRGIPVYVGNGDYRPDGRDYAWVEGQQGYPGHGYGHHQQAYGYPGYGYGAVITETTVTTSPTVIQETVYEEVVHSAPRRSHRSKGRRIGSKARCNC